MSIEIAEGTNEAARSDTWTYLNHLLPHESMWPLQSREEERRVVPHPSVVFEARVNGERVGAAYAGPSWDEAGDVLKNEIDRLAHLILYNVRTLHGVGVEQAHRGQRIGSGLVAATERVAAESGASLIIGVAQGAHELERFYTRLGYVVGEPARPLILRAGHESGVFPQGDPESRWFYKYMGSAGATGPVRALHPTDRQLRLLRAGADDVRGNAL
ncbi:GNAT family N-acetyltransferase [Curtobacterium flaccumfaciens]|uniref:GNAT family N-acetyltransferase n=1 Tax=Curtobacterium flaccumfaciens TaxID=2035 RepID=UPI001BDE31F6|nr:GNAT family N-acetyltransferase [Curtobacterium flaccumfaciens]MBT1631520.1 GNAT family N-acetyltransferase [Curtobacterium flaccumfaciens pv. oortii]MCX2846828.1 GNAT family N-acetyltransferase [Curtobacterium flaccumfaciens pv. oortii]